MATSRIAPKDEAVEANADKTALESESSGNPNSVFAPANPQDNRFRDDDSDFVKYVGVALSRDISSDNLKSVGVEGPDLHWDASNNYEIQVDLKNTKLIKILFDDGNFLLPASLKEELTK